MIRYLIILLIIKSSIFACSLCSVFTPRTHISTHIKADNENIQSIYVNWAFAKQFGDELMQIYDLNQNKTFDEVELLLIEDALIEYLITRNFITTIYYDKNIESNSIDFVIKDYKMKYKNSILEFEYNIDLENLKIYDENFLTIRIFDKEGYFFIIFENDKQKFDIPYKIQKNTNISEVSYKIFAPNLEKQKFNIQAFKENPEQKNLYETWTNNSSILKEKPQNAFETQSVKSEDSFMKDITNKFVNNIKKYLLDIENGDKISLVFLLMASFLYGIIHALGPGHGKALAFSYFSSQKSSYFEAFVISMLTAFIHIIGALLIVLVSVFVLQSILDSLLEDSISYITAFSAVIIMFLALYILYRKLNKKSCSCCACTTNVKETKFKPLEKQNFIFKNQNIKVHKNTQRNKKQDLIFVLTAGIIPCPGTVLLFVYAFLLKTYFAVFLASLSISLGMALVIFASSFLGVGLHKISSKSKNLVNILEILAPIFMFALALFLLFSSKFF